MPSWKNENLLEILTEGAFESIQSDTLCMPIDEFNIYRNDNLALILETKSKGFPSKEWEKVLAGTVGASNQKLEVIYINGMKAIFNGVNVFNQNISSKHTGSPETTEKSSIHSVDVTVRESANPTFTIDWLQNKNDSFIFPVSMEDKVETIHTRTFDEKNDNVVMKSNHASKSFSRRVVGLTVSGLKIYICIKPKQSKDSSFILYLGTPSEADRKKIRNCISFALGMKFVFLGYSNFCENWNLARFKLQSVYGFDKKMLDLPVMPPTPLHETSNNIIDSERLDRLVNSLYFEYEKLNFPHLSWLYWHAVCSPSHTQAVQFGASIEALQNVYLESNKEVIQNKLLDKETWGPLKKKLLTEVDAISDDATKKILKNKIGELNRPPQGVLIERLFTFLKLNQSEIEKTAWQRRNDAGHGKETLEDDFANLIRENRLLRTRFHRMILAMTNGNDTYYDYYTCGFPVRKLADPIPAESQVECQT